MSFFAGTARIVTVLRSSDYGLYAAGNLINLTGTWMHWIGVGWLAWELTGSTFWLGLVAFADLFPTVVLGPIAGTLADRWERLKMLKVCQVLAGIQAVVLFGFALSGALTAPLLLALTLALGIVTAFSQPARLALVPSLVKADYLNTAVGLNSVNFNMARFIGPLIAALVISFGEIAFVFALNALTYVFFFIVLSKIKLVAPFKPKRSSTHMFADLREGLSFVLGQRRIAAHLALLAIFFMCARPLIDLLPAFADQVFRGGPQVLSMLTAALGAGAMVGGLWLAGRHVVSNYNAIILRGAFAACLALPVFVLSGTLWVALGAAFLAGGAFTVFGAGTQTVLQIETPGEMRGRALSLYGLIIRGGPALGGPVIGAIAEFTGLSWPFLGSAVIVALAAWAISRHIR